MRLRVKPAMTQETGEKGKPRCPARATTFYPYLYTIDKTFPYRSYFQYNFNDTIDWLNHLGLSTPNCLKTLALLRKV